MVPLQGRPKTSLMASSDFYYPCNPKTNKVNAILCKGTISGPYTKGKEVGMLEILLHNNKIGEIPLLAAEEVKRVGFINLLLYWLKNIISRVKEVLTFG